MEEFYAPYQSLHEQVIEACECIAGNRCYVLGSEIETIKFALDRITVSSWDDSAASAFIECKNSCANDLGVIVDSIASVFVEGENVYNLLKLQLDNLKAADENYKTIFNSKPVKEDFCHTETETNDDGTTHTTTTYPGFDSAIERWNTAIKNITEECNNCIEAITEYENILEQINGVGISASATAGFSAAAVPQIYNPKYFAFSSLLLSVDSQKNDILELYASSTNPIYSRFSQGEGYYGLIAFGPPGKNIYTSGCGVCSFASAISSVLTRQYGQNVSINPGELLDSLYALGGGRNKETYYSGGLAYDEYTSSKVSRDITSAFKDVSIIEFDYDTSGVMNQENLEAITNAGGSLCMSLKSRGHFVSVNDNDGNGKFYISDSGIGTYQGKAIGINTEITGTSGTGYISGKKVWAIIPNSAITVTGDQISINGVDATSLPSITAFETAGKAYDVKVNSDGSMLVDGLTENYTYEV